MELKTINPKCIWCGKKRRKFLKYYCGSECYKMYQESAVKIPIIGEIKDGKIRLFDKIK